MAEYCSNHIKDNTETVEPEGVTDGNNWWFCKIRY
jgi:hypothetical protein